MLYKEKSDCCGCRACSNICPVNAIQFQPDQYGFLYPAINTEMCMNCGECTRVCDFQKAKRHVGIATVHTFAAVHKDPKVLKRSSSGGVFAALAKDVLNQKGVVFGCILNDDMEPVHVSIETESGLLKMHGSKYVQSNIGFAYRETKQYLDDKRQVLFSGTPCQIAALKTYLGRDYANLLTVDFVCHGVPSSSMFIHYIKYLERKHRMKITGYNFRSKSRGWPGLVSVYRYKKSGWEGKKKLGLCEEFYFPYFLKGNISRPSCYQCRYANPYRISDITIGDFWGYQKASLGMKVTKGLSVCLLNTEKSLKLFPVLKESMNLEQVKPEIILQGNKNFRNPVKMGGKWEESMRAFAEEGIESIAARYLRENRREILKEKIAKYFPLTFSRAIRQVIRQKEKNAEWNKSI